MKTHLLLLLVWISGQIAFSQAPNLDQYNVVWETQSKNSSESMPCGGGNIGLNVWVENGEILCYLSQSGTFDENNAMLKLGRVRVKFSPNLFDGGKFRQELKLREGYVQLNAEKDGKKAKVKIWVDVFRPVVHIESECSAPTTTEAIYENWRIADRVWTTSDEMKASRNYMGAPFKAVVRKDSVQFDGNRICWYHRNRDKSLFDDIVKQQDLETIKSKLTNPLKNLTFGGMMTGQNMQPAGNTRGRYADADFIGWKLQSVKQSKKQSVNIYLYTENSPTLADWKNSLLQIEKEEKSTRKKAFEQTLAWWAQFWQRSYIAINPAQPDTSKGWEVGRNYQLFRYQLGCNAYGKYPSKFNGGLFTYDPSYVSKNYTYPPDHRNWGGGTHTAQNQRLLYWPMIKGGDFDMMKPQFEFYRNMLNNAELRTQYYWGHKGASFTEQIEQFGLPNASEWSWDRPANAAKGVEYNNWLEYVWDTSLEFCQMILDVQKYTGQDISRYMPLIESCLVFFDEHYQQEAMSRSKQALDGNGKLILYPGSGAETYKMAYNATSTIAALQTVCKSLLALPDNYLSKERKTYFEGLLKRIPPITFREREGKKTIAPAATYARLNNVEITQLYPVYPWGIYGVGRPDLDVAINTWKYGMDRPDQKNIISWHQDAIFCACMGLTDEAKDLTIKKLKNAPRRYPTFWGPGHDWVPDHNWGGSGMIGLQEMLMQTIDRRILLFPAWPKEWNVAFKLHAPYNTIVEGELRNGKVENLKVTPEERRKDVEIFIPL